MPTREAPAPPRPKGVLERLAAIGQSLWYDDLRRGLVRSGELARMVREEGIQGVTSNPTIFEKAISGSTDYDQALRTLAAEGRSAAEIREALVVEDIREAAQILRPVHDRTGGRDGFVSVEVSPELARDTQGTVAEARRLWREIDRPNLMVKVPGTKEGLGAITQLTDEGISVNVTLLFSIRRSTEVALAYMKGLERRAKRGEPLEKIASIASFFVSRVDSAVDARLPASSPLRGRVAIANAKLAYARHGELLAGEAWRKLERKGARPQRLLWASTSAKDPAYRDVRYVEELIGPDTVNTVPRATLRAFLDHGNVRPSLTEDLDGARRTLEELERAGISLEAVCQDLLRDGIAAFAASFAKLARCIDGRRQAILDQAPERTRATLGLLEPAVQGRLHALAQAELPARIQKKDPTLWKDDKQHAEIIENRLGWLHVTGPMRGRIDELRSFADEVRNEGFRRALVLGMGGSSLFPAVLAATFGTREGFLELEVLDSTDPAAVLEADKWSEAEKTLFVVSSKSGTTVEPLSFHRHFADEVKDPRAFIAITDPRTPLEKLAREAGFRRVFSNPPDVGGRYSALTYMGLVPAALLGVDIGELLDRAERMSEACATCVSVDENPGVRLGAILGEAARAGRDKLTLVLSPELASFGAWIEQLVAESTGKEERGILPVDREDPGPPAVYEKDRIFVALALRGSRDTDHERRIEALASQGEPVVRIELEDRHDIGAEVFRWELATATAAAVFEVDPFDEPDVAEAKILTRELLADFARTGELPPEAPLCEEDGIAFFADPALCSTCDTIGSWLSAHLGRARIGDYVAFLAFVPQSPQVDHELLALRHVVRDERHLATTLGYGPRYLHSTGQFHKGGPNKGVFLEITCDDARDVKIPGERNGFSTLKKAQAKADFDALERYGRRVARCHIRGDLLVGLKKLLEHVRGAC